MTGDQTVSAQAILRAELMLRRKGLPQILTELEQVEPDLASYAFESLSDVHQQLLHLGGNAKRSRRLFDQIQNLVVTCIESLREGHYQLWQNGQQLPDGPAGDEPSDPNIPNTPDTPQQP